MVFEAEKVNDNGIYDTAAWKILDPPAPPSNQNKKIKKKLFGGSKEKKEKKEKNEADTPSETQSKQQRPNEESKNDELQYDSVASFNGKSTGKQLDSGSGGGKYAIIEKERSSQSSVDGLLVDDAHANSVRSSSVAAGKQRDSVRRSLSPCKLLLTV